MASNRINRINDEIQRELAAQIRSLKDPRVSGTGMVSITRVDTTNDLRYARVYVSVLNKDQEKEVLKGLKSASGFLRRELGRALQSSCLSATTPSRPGPIFWSFCVCMRRRTRPGAPGRRRNDHAHHTGSRRAAAVL